MAPVALFVSSKMKYLCTEYAESSYSQALHDLATSSAHFHSWPHPTVTFTCSHQETLTRAPIITCFQTSMPYRYCSLQLLTPLASCLVGEHMHPLRLSSNINLGFDALSKSSRQDSRCTINKCLNSLFNNKVVQNALKKCSTRLKRFIVLCPIS